MYMNGNSLFQDPARCDCAGGEGAQPHSEDRADLTREARHRPVGRSHLTS